MRLLVLLSRVPYPLEKGDKLRAFHHLKHLAEKHEIILCCINDTKLHPKALQNLNPFCKEIHIINISKLAILFNLLKGIFSSKPIQVAYFYHKKAQKIVDKLVEKHAPNRIYCQLIRVTEYVKKYTIIPKTLDYMDAFSEGMNKRINNASPFLKPVFKMEARRLKNYESIIFNSFEQKVIISEQDRDFIDHPQKKEIAIIPNGIDMDYFKRTEQQPKYDLLFCGNMNYPPNIESALYIVKNILPLVEKTHPTITVLIAGVNPHHSVRALTRKNVYVSGWMSDIRNAYNSSSIFIAPMQTGAGLQNKLLEAMAMELPCVTSILANNALKANPETEILIGQNPEDYAAKITTLLTNLPLKNSIAKNGFAFVKTNFSWINSVNRLERIILKH